MSESLPYQKLERLFHEPARLAILSVLIGNPHGVGFTALREELDLTFGNLDRHLKALSEAAIIDVDKRRGNGRPQTTVRLSESGRAQFLAYLDSLEQVLQAAAQAHAGKAVRRQGGVSEDGASPEPASG